MSIKEDFKRARDYFREGNYQRAFYYINNCIIIDSGKKEFRELYNKIRSFYYQELLGLSGEDYQDLTSLLNNCKIAIKNNNPDSANNYLEFIKKQFPSITLDFSYNMNTSDFWIYTHVRGQQYSFFICKCQKETFQELGNKEDYITII